MKLKFYLRTLLLGIAAGFCIGIGGIVFLRCENSHLGAVLFSVGLLTILVFGFNLFTGMVGNLTDRLFAREWSYLFTVAVVWLGNLIGTGLAALAVRPTRLGDAIAKKSLALAETKLADDWYSLILLGVFCGMLMYIAVAGFKNNIGKKDTLCCLLVVFGVVVFIVAGFEHSIADMFYFWLSGTMHRAIVPLLLITLGNAIGGNLIPLALKATKEKE